MFQAMVQMKSKDLSTRGGSNKTFNNHNVSDSDADSDNNGNIYGTLSRRDNSKGSKGKGKKGKKGKDKKGSGASTVNDSKPDAQYIYLNAGDIRFTYDSIANTFPKGVYEDRTLHQVANTFYKNELLARDFEMIEVYYRTDDGRFYATNNRRLAILRLVQLGCEKRADEESERTGRYENLPRKYLVKAHVVPTTSGYIFSWKNSNFSTKNDGKSIRVRGTKSARGEVEVDYRIGQKLEKTNFPIEFSEFSNSITTSKESRERLPDEDLAKMLGAIE